MQCHEQRRSQWITLMLYGKSTTAQIWANSSSALSPVSRLRKRTSFCFLHYCIDTSPDSSG